MDFRPYDPDNRPEPGASPAVLPPQVDAKTPQRMQPWQPAVSGSGIEEPDDTGDLPPVPPGADLAPARLHWLLPLAVFAITFLIYASLIPRILRYSSPPTGDQPSYLMITNSIVEDGDL